MPYRLTDELGPIVRAYMLRSLGLANTVEEIGTAAHSISRFKSFFMICLPKKSLSIEFNRR